MGWVGLRGTEKRMECAQRGDDDHAEMQTQWMSGQEHATGRRQTNTVKHAPRLA